MSAAGPLGVALLSPCFWPEVRRGTERVVRDLADHLIGRGHQPTLITSHAGRPSLSVEDDLPIVRNWRPPDDRLKRRRYEDHMTHVPFSYAALRRGSYDLAHAFFPTDALAAARWSERGGGPAILSYMGIPDHPGLMARRRRLEITREATGRCAATVAISEHARAAFWRWLGVEAHVIYPGVDVEAFAPGGGRSGVPTIFCGAAPEEPRKRVGLLVAAFDLVRRDRPDARLVLSAPRDPAVASRLARPGVELREVSDRRRLAASYREAWVSALPSTGEAFGLVLAEALACGTPVVATDVGGMREVCDRPEVGRLFGGDDPTTLARALLEVLEMANTDGTAAACRARAEEFSTARQGERYEQLYRELLAG